MINCLKICWLMMMKNLSLNQSRFEERKINRKLEIKYMNTKNKRPHRGVDKTVNHPFEEDLK